MKRTLTAALAMGSVILCCKQAGTDIIILCEMSLTILLILQTFYSDGQHLQENNWLVLSDCVTI